MVHSGDTIAAIATARGRAALAIVRVSGPEAIGVADSCFHGKSLRDAAPQTVHFGRFETADGDEIDQVVATVFRAPRSSTGEDVVEISCHGGDFVPQLILKGLLAAGARMAQPGEFTQRAFINGKVDLTQAEAVADLIHARSTLAHRTAIAQLEGRYSASLSELRRELLEVCSYVELELDFSEEDVEFADRKHLVDLLQRVGKVTGDLLDSHRLGTMIRDGVRVVIAGRPNAGKSTLLNALVGRDRAIVSETPGTTRDEIEVDMEIGGLNFRFVDTAGLREAADLIEAEGVRRAHRSIEHSDVLLYVFDVTRGLDDGEEKFLETLRRNRSELPAIIVMNKSDLVDDDVRPVDLSGIPSVVLSAARGQRDPAETAALVELLREAAADDLSDTLSSPVLVNERHRQHLVAVCESVSRASGALAKNASGDVLSVDLRVALRELGEITGEITNEDVLDQIFSRFCIGK